MEDNETRNIKQLGWVIYGSLCVGIGAYCFYLSWKTQDVFFRSFFLLGGGLLGILGFCLLKKT